MHVTYATATTANGFLATLDDSLAWLFAVTGDTPDLDALYAAADAVVTDNITALRGISGDGTVWVQGGGDLAGQYLDADLLDDVTLHISPAFLSEGKPLFPRNLASDRMTLVDVRRTGQFIEATWQVRNG